MAVIARRSVLAAAVGAAVASLAAAMVLRKPSGPPVVALTRDTPPAAVRLQTMAALKPTDPPRALPAIGFVDAAGVTHGLGEYAGKVVVLNLWATWCPPCVAEMPSLAALARQAAGEGVVVLPLSTDRGGAAVVERFYRAHNIAGPPVLLDTKAAAAEALGARGLPTTLIIDRAGRERARLEGGADWSSPDALAAIRKLAA